MSINSLKGFRMFGIFKNYVRGGGELSEFNMAKIGKCWDGTNRRVAYAFIRTDQGKVK